MSEQGLHGLEIRARVQNYFHVKLETCQIMRRQILLVPAIHDPHAAVLHLLWSHVRGNHTKPADGCSGFQQLVPHNEPVFRLCHSQTG